MATLIVVSRAGKLTTSTVDSPPETTVDPFTLSRNPDRFATEFGKARRAECHNVAYHDPLILAGRQWMSTLTGLSTAFARALPHMETVEKIDTVANQLRLFGSVPSVQAAARETLRQVGLIAADHQPTVRAMEALIATASAEQKRGWIRIVTDKVAPITEAAQSCRFEALIVRIGFAPDSDLAKKAELVQAEVDGLAEKIARPLDETLSFVTAVRAAQGLIKDAVMNVGNLLTELEQEMLKNASEYVVGFTNRVMVRMLRKQGIQVGETESIPVMVQKFDDCVEGNYHSPTQVAARNLGKPIRRKTKIGTDVGASAEEAIRELGPQLVAAFEPEAAPNALQKIAIPTVLGNMVPSDVRLLVERMQKDDGLPSNQVELLLVTFCETPVAPPAPSKEPAAPATDEPVLPPYCPEALVGKAPKGLKDADTAHAFRLLWAELARRGYENVDEAMVVKTLLAAPSLIPASKHAPSRLRPELDITLTTLHRKTPEVSTAANNSAKM